MDDLLAGYGSSEEEEEEVVNGDNRGRPSVAVSASVADGTAARCSSQTSSSGRPAAKGPPPYHSTSQSARGRKILSLTSVLPSRIVDRITKAQARSHAGGVNDEDDDDDDDTDDGVWEDRRGPDNGNRPNHSSTETTEAATASGKDERISRLLLDLRAAPSAKAAAAGGTGKIVHVGANQASSLYTSSRTGSDLQPLGMAFATTTTTTATISTAMNGVHDLCSNVIDIHASASARTSTRNRSSPTSHPTESPDEHGVPPVPESRPVSALPGALQPPSRKQTRLLSSAAPAVGYAAVNRTTDRIMYTSSSGEFNARSYPEPSTTTTTSPAAPADGAYGGVRLPQEEDLGASSKNRRKKRSRQELERALRHGDLTAIEQHLDGNTEGGEEVGAGGGMLVRTIRQADPAEHRYEPNLEAQWQSDSRGGAVRSGPAPMYDPTTGTLRTDMATANSGIEDGGDGSGSRIPNLKGRGKNQIHHVVAAAAQLEVQRIRQQHVSSSSTTSSHRANAKAKYGW